MDSLTQAALGASVAGVCAPAGHRRKALLVGAVLGTLPDLDVLIDYGDPVANMTYHRGFSHSLFVLAPFAVLLWLTVRRFWEPVRAAPSRWLAAIALTLLTHPLLDAHTVYGTQLLWPLTSPPVMWSTMFIIDPLYTLPLIIGVLVAAARPNAGSGTGWLAAGLALSCVYLGWSWVAKSMIERDAEAALREVGLENAPRFSTPAPLTTLLWRVVVLTDTGYLEGQRSLIADRGTMQFEAFGSDHAAKQAADSVWAVRRLRWFAHDFLDARVDNDVLVLTDLRMGQHPTYIFSHAVARRSNPHWQEIPARRLPTALNARDLASVWRRLIGSSVDGV